MAARELQRILHVDDDRDILEIVRLALEGKAGFSVESCTSAEQALERAAAFKPDLVLLDVMMPGTGGLELYEAIRSVEGLGEVEVVFMTSAAQTIDMRTYARTGALGTIMKPFDYATLADTVREIWNEKHG